MATGNMTVTMGFNEETLRAIEELKIGARNSRSDQKRIQDAHDLMVENGAECAGGKSVDTDNLISFGGEIKALGDGKVGGYLVRFSTANDPDLTGDYFTKDTDFGEATEAAPWFHHRLPLYIGGKVAYPAIKSPFGGAVSLVKDEFGVFASAVLDMRNKYENFVHGLIEEGKIGWSSGTNTAERVRGENGKAAWLKTWILGEDASYTPTPAEYRNSVVSLKSLLPPDKAALPIEGENITLPVQPDKEIEMTPEEVKAMIDAANEKRDAEVKAAELKAAETKAVSDAAYKKGQDELLAELKARGFNAPAYNTQPLGFSAEKDAVPGFMAWVKTGQENGALLRPDSSMLAIKGAGDAFNVTTSGSGGALVPDPLLDRIIAKRNAASWIRRAPCQYFTTESDHLLIPREVTSMSDFVLTAESAAYDENEGTVGQIDLALLKYTKMTQVTEEFLLGKNSNFESWFMDRLGAAAANTENTIATTALLAGATAATAAASQTALTIAEMERLAGTLGEGYAVAGQTGYIMKRSTHFYLRGIQLASYQPWDFGGEPVFEAAGMGAMTNALYSTGFGNFNYFAVLERPGMLVQRNPWLHMGTGEIDFFANIFRAVAVLQGEAFYKMAQA